MMSSQAKNPTRSMAAMTVTASVPAIMASARNAWVAVEESHTFGQRDEKKGSQLA